jgi:hypothetical protein
MKLLNVLIVPIIGIFVFSCKSPDKEVELVDSTDVITNSEKNENLQMIPEVSDKLVISFTNDLSDEKELLYFEIKTYCKSYNLPFVNITEFESSNLPVCVGTDTVVVLDKEWFPKDWDEGLLLLNPDSMPLFIKYSHEVLDFTASKADAYFGYSNDIEIDENNVLSQEYYDKQYSKILVDADEFYRFDRKITSLNDRYVDYQKLAGIPNEEFLPTYLTLKYLIANDENELLANVLINYPIIVRLDSKKVTINNSVDFLSNWDEIFNTEVIDVLENTKYYQMGAESNMLYIGNGELCFGKTSKGIQIIKINN